MLSYCLFVWKLDLCLESLLTKVSVCLFCFRRTYTALIGETAVAFDFGPLAVLPKNVTGQREKEDVLAYPMYILYENGETFLIYINLLHR